MKWAQNGSRRIPDWIDDALRRAVHPDPLKRQEAISEFIADLRRPNPDYVPDHSRPLIERDPLMFWQALSLILAVVIVFLLVRT